MHELLKQLLKIWWFFSISQIVSRPLKINKNRWKLPVLEIFAFSSTFFRLKMKYYHLKFFFVENMHELEDFGKFDNLNFLFLDFFAFSNIYNPVPNISRKVKKSSKGRHLNQKILISVFKYFLSAIAKIYFCRVGWT